MLDYSSQGIAREYKKSNVVLGIGMGLTEKEKDGFPDPSSVTPMGLDLEHEVPRFLVYCLGINPNKLGKQELQSIEQAIQKREVVGIKIYLGYYPFYAYDDVYAPVYELAIKYNMPVVFHTGDTYSERRLLKYSHPLILVEVAVNYRDINFIMAHFGDPWCVDGAEVVYKNRSMYADLSGLIVGVEENEGISKDKAVCRIMNEALH